MKTSAASVECMECAWLFVEGQCSRNVNNIVALADCVKGGSSATLEER